MDDAQLLRSFVEENSHDAFQRLVTRHIDLVYSAALRRTAGDPHRAEEVTQMVFTDLARKARSLLRHPLLPAWLHQATRWSAASLRRSEQRRTHHESLAASDPAVGFCAEGETSANWTALQPLLDDALDSLNDTDRAAILQRFFQQQPFAIIAASLGVSENTARMRVDRALEKLRNHLTRRGLTSTSAALGLALASHGIHAAPPHLATTLGPAALASASATTGLLTTLVMTKLQLGLATAATLALAAGLLWQHQANDLLGARLSALETRRASQASALASLEAETAIREATLQARATLADASTQLPPLTPEQLERHQLDTFIRKGELDADFAPLFRRLNLPPAQLDAFKTLLVARNQASYDATKLAEKNGVVFASLAEQRALTDSVLGEIDARIAATLGPGHLAAFREHLDLAPYLKLTDHIAHLNWSRQSFETRFNTNADARTEEFARLLRETAPEYPDLLYRANGWPVPWPAAFTQAAAALVPPESRTLFQRHIESMQVENRLREIARDAALQGKLELSEGSAREYPSRKPATSRP
jgi:RNA polymerase sigma factor (sigma-70 family)